MRSAMKRNPDFIFDTADDALAQYALTTPYDPLFYLCLDILRLRGCEAILAEIRRAADTEEESLGRRFAIARACGDSAGALAIVEREGGVIALVPDLILAAREANRLGPLLDYCIDRRTLTSWYRNGTGVHALLDELTAERPAQERALLDLMPRYRAESVSSRRKVHLTGIAKVHNEGRRVRRLVESLLAFCDDVIVWDHRSDDGSLDALDTAMPGARARFSIIRSSAPDYDEKMIYDGLFAAARQRGATHICQFDADEILALGIDPAGLRDVAARLEPGDIAAIQLLQFVGTAGDFIDFAKLGALAVAQYFLPQWREFIYADEGRLQHAPSALHCSWIPQDAAKRRTFLDPSQAKLLHMDKTDPEAGHVKSDWYKAKELLLHNLDVERLVSRYMFHALPYAFLERCLTRGPAVDCSIDVEVEAKRTAEKRRELEHWLTQIKLPLEKWLFYHADGNP